MSINEFPPSLLDVYIIAEVAYMTSAVLNLDSRFARMSSLNRKLRALPEWKTYLTDRSVLELTWKDVVDLPEGTPIRGLIKRHGYAPVILIAQHAKGQISSALGKVRTPSTLLYLLQFSAGVKVGVGCEDRLISYKKPWMLPVLREFSVKMESPRALEAAVKKFFREYASGSDEFFVGVHFEDVKKFILDRTGKTQSRDRRRT